MNLAAPIAWLVETSERVMLERAIASIERNRAGLFRRDPDDEQGRNCLRVARERLTDFLDDVRQGPLAEQARAQHEELRRLSRSRRWRRAALVIAAIATIILTRSGFQDLSSFGKASALLKNPGPLPPREIEEVPVPSGRAFVISRPPPDHNHPVRMFPGMVLVSIPDPETFLRESVAASLRALMVPDESDTAWPAGCCWISGRLRVQRMANMANNGGPHDLWGPRPGSSGRGQRDTPASSGWVSSRLDGRLPLDVRASLWACRSQRCDALRRHRHGQT
jgi:hypothetical protein